MKLISVTVWFTTRFVSRPVDAVNTLWRQLRCVFVRLTCLFTPWSGFLLGKTTGPHLVKKFSAFYGTWRFIAAFTSVLHLPLSWARSIQFLPPSQFLKIHLNIILPNGVPRGDLGVQIPPPPRNSEGPPTSCQNQPNCENLKIAEFRTPTHKDVRKKGIRILKLPSVRNCFTLAMTNKLVVIINSLKVPKI